MAGDEAFHLTMDLVVDAADQVRMRRCLELFEDFCVVTQSVRGGIDVDVVAQAAGRDVAA